MIEIKAVRLAPGTICKVITDNNSRLFKGDTVRIIKYLPSSREYYVQREEGMVNCTISENDIETLTSIIANVQPQDIHFLKVDVEGFERQVLEGYDFRVRPWVICMESTKPNTEIPCYEEWEHILIDHGYALKKAHGINRYYVDLEREWK